MSTLPAITVMKFGGTSMADEQTWNRVLDLIADAGACVVVVSATARTTRRLRLAADLACRGELGEAESIAKEIRQRHMDIVNGFVSSLDEKIDVDRIQQVRRRCAEQVESETQQLESLLQSVYDQRKLSARQLDAISSVGERISSYLLAQCGPLKGLETRYVDAAEVMITNTTFGKAQPELNAVSERARILSDHVQLNHIPVMGGYYGKTLQGDITTLGLEGSDYTASILGYALHASRIEIWTDVSGVYSSDPRYINTAEPVHELTYQEAREMAALGAKVLHPNTLEPAKARNIPVQVKNMFDPEAKGTTIHQSSDSARPVTAIAFKEDNTLLKVQAQTPRDRSKVLAVLDRFNMAPDLAVGEQYGITLSMDLDESQRQRFIEEMQSELPTEVSLHLGQLALIGCAPELDTYLLKHVFDVLEDIPVKLFGRGHQRSTFILTVPGDRTLEAVHELHDRLCSQQSELWNYRMRDHKN
jgi:aspartate kinase